MWTLRYIATVVAITAVTVAAGVFIWNSEEAQQIDTEPGTPYASWYTGPEDALVVIEAFPDFECTQCVAKERFAMQAIEIYPVDVRFTYHPFLHSDFGFEIAEALEAAGAQGRFWDMHNLLIEDVPENMEELNALALEIGLDMDAFSEALASGRYAASINAAMDEAISRGVHDVSLFINGKEYLKYPGTFEDMRQAIAQELEGIKADGTE